jgi:adenylate kinase family enzyme
MRRIHVVGTSGSGKTTLARQIAERLDIPHVELDALHWEPHWTKRYYERGSLVRWRAAHG